MNDPTFGEQRKRQPAFLISGVSSGIGAETARRLIEKGARVLGISRRPAAHPSVLWQQCDVRDPEAVHRSVHRLLEEVDALDAVVCNAGVGHLGSIEEVSDRTIREVFDTNYFGVVNLVRATLDVLRTQRRGRIVIVGSLAGRVPLPFQAHYSASKAAVESLAFSLQMEVAPFGISVSLVEPGDVRTAFNDAMLCDSPEGSPYRDAYSRCGARVHELMDSAPGPEVVADLVAAVLRSASPALRYPVGPSSGLVSLAKRMFPDALNVRLIRRTYGL